MGRIAAGLGLCVFLIVDVAGSLARSDSLFLLRPTDDALVLSDPERVDENFGDLPFLLAWANYPVYGARSYIAFDLSSIPAGEDVTFARLNLFQFAGGGYSSGVDLYHVTDDGWSEGTITGPISPCSSRASRRSSRRTPC